MLALEADAANAPDDEVRLTASSDDERQVTAVFVRGHSGGPFVVHQATFLPWASWPSSGVLGPVRSTSVEIGSGPVAARSANKRYAFAGSSGGTAELFPSLDPTATGGAPAGHIPLSGVDATFLAARAAGLSGATHLVGAYDPSGAIVGYVVGSGGVTSVVLGCATGQPATAAGVAFGDGWLVAVSSGSPAPPGCAGPKPGSPTRIDVLRVAPDASLAYVAGIETDTVLEIQVAPHPDGAYVVWQPVDALGASTVRAVRVLAATGGLVGPVEIAPASELTSGFAAAAVGRLLAVARHRDPSGLVVAVYDESLAPMASTTHAQAPFLGPTSALGSPDGLGVLVAWTARGMQPSQPSRGDVARFDCLP